MKNLKTTFQKFGFDLNQTQEKQFEDYYNLLIETNKQLNLTAIVEEEEVIIKHFLDSILPEKHFTKNAVLADIGTGAGFPGVPLKIFRPDLKVLLVDSLNKRIEFLKNLTTKLNLTEISCLHSRAEDLAKTKREVFDIVTARAVAPLNTLVEYLLPLVKVGGKAIIYKSSKLEEELKISKNAITLLGGNVDKIEDYFLLDNERKILIINKIKPTPLKYPRIQNKPRTNPIV